MDDDSKVGRLNDTLYSRTRYKNPVDKRVGMDQVDGPEVEEKWHSPDLKEILQSERKAPEAHPIMKTIFKFSLVFFVIAVAIATFVFLGGSNFVSSKNVDITVLGPTSVSAGDTLELGVTIKNKNNADLQLANFSVQYPAETRDPENTSKLLNFTKEDLGEVGAGGSAVRNVRMILFGTEGDIKEIKFSVEYKVKGSNATFYKDKVYEVSIGKPPITFTVDASPTVTSGDTFNLSLFIASNGTETLKDVMVRGEYPYGYTVIDSTPQVSSEGNIWSLGDLTPGSKKSIQIRGQLQGENNEERTFRFYVGVRDAGSANPNFKTILISVQKTVAISRPSVGLSINFNGESGDTYIAPPSATVGTTIRFQNNLPDKLINPHLEVKLSGAALDKFTISPQNNGFYDSQNSKIVWNPTNLSGDTALNPGDEGRVSFNFSSIANLPSTNANREIKLTFSLSGLVNGKAINITESRSVKISSQVSLSSKALYSKGPFKNTGPIPPKADTTTTYTVTLNVSNTQNSVDGAKVTARLGQNVKWLEASIIDGENVSYDEGANVVTWDLGTLDSGSGFSSAGRTASFQVSLTPSISQIDTAPVLVNNITFSGDDTFTGSTVTATNQPLTTRLSSDPAFIQGDDIVVK